MLRQHNPHNVIAFYDFDSNEAHKGYLHSPVASLPPFQFTYPDDGETVDTWALVNVDTGVESAQTVGQIEVEAVTALNTSWFTYKGTALTNAPVPGMYQIVVTLTGGGVIRSHRILMTRAFDSFAALGLAVGDCLSDPEGLVFSIDFAATFGAWGTDRVLLDLNDTGNFVFISTLSDFTLTHTDLGTTGGAPIIRIETTTVLPNEPGAVNTVYRDYRYTWAEGFPCDGVLTAVATSQAEYAQDAYVLAFTNTNDLQDLALLYQTSYIQKFYFFGYRLEHVPVLDQNFELNGEGGRFLSQVTNREQIALDFWPMPDYLQAVLQAADQHDTVTLRNFGGTDETIYEIGCEKKDVAGAVCPGGTLRFTSAPVAVQGCETDYELA